MSAVPYGYDYQVPGQQQRRPVPRMASTVRRQTPGYGGGPLTVPVGQPNINVDLPDVPEPQAPASPMLPGNPPAGGGYFGLQNARSDRQRNRTIQLNAARQNARANFAAAAPLPTDPTAQAARSAYIGERRAAADDIAGMVPGGDPNRYLNRGLAQDRNARENMVAPAVAASLLIPGTGHAALQARPMNPHDRALAVKAYVDTGLDPNAAERKVAADEARMAQQQPFAGTPYALPGSGGAQQAAPQPMNLLPGQPPAPTTQPAPAQPPAVAQNNGRAGIGMSEQIAREMLRALGSENQGTAVGQLGPQFAERLGKYGVSPETAGQLWQKFSGQGFQTDYPTATTTTAPAQARADVAPNRATGQGGTATLPSGQRVVVGANGQRVGASIGQDAPLPPTQQTTITMGPQRGATPIAQAVAPQPTQQQQATATPPPGRGMGEFRQAEAPPHAPPAPVAQAAPPSTPPAVKPEIANATDGSFARDRNTGLTYRRVGGRWVAAQ